MNNINENQKRKPLKKLNSKIRALTFSLNEQVCGYASPFINENSLANFLQRTTHKDEYYLTEALYEHDLDIEYIYENYAKPFIEDLLKNSKQYIDEYRKNGEIVYRSFDSSELPSDFSKQSHRKNPVRIFIGISDENSIYDHNKKIIKINVLYGSFIQDMIDDHMYSFDEIFLDSYNELKALIYRDIKPAIAHELAHWFDDSLKQEAIKKYIDVLKKRYKKQSDAQWNLLRSYIEIQGYIHDVKQHKNQMSQEEWDALSFKQFFELIGLDNIADEIRHDKYAFAKWKKQLFKRLAREDLIGKNMKSEEIGDL